MPAQNNGVQTPPAFSDCQIIFNTYNFYGSSPAINNYQAAAMPQGVNQGQQGTAQPYPLVGLHQNIQGNQNLDESLRRMAIGNQPGSPAPTPGNAQPLQQNQADQLPQINRAQLNFCPPEDLPASAQYLLRVLKDNPVAMDGLTQIYTAYVRQLGTQDHAPQPPHLQLPGIHPQPDGQQFTQNQQILRSVERASPGEAPQMRENLGTSPAISDHTPPQNTEGDDEDQDSDVPTTPIASSPPQAGTPSSFGTPTGRQPLFATGTTREIQKSVAALIKQRATAYKGYIKNDDELAYYEEAVWRAKRKEEGIQNKCAGFPDDFNGKMAIAERIFNAIQNMDGEQDPASDRGEFEDCVAVKVVKGLSALETEMIAHKLIEDMRKVQCGECILYLPAEHKIVQAASFTDKLDQVVDALNVSTRSVLARRTTLL